MNRYFACAEHKIYMWQDAFGESGALGACKHGYSHIYTYTFSTIYKQTLRMLIIHTYNKIHSTKLYTAMVV